MAGKVEIRWEVEDGYVGKSRPQSFEVDLDEFEDDMTHDEIVERVCEATDEDMANKVSYCFSNFDEFVEVIKRHLTEREGEES